MRITVLMQVATLHGLHNLAYVGGRVFVEDTLSLRHADDLRRLASVGAARGTLPPLDPWFASDGRVRNPVSDAGGVLQDTGGSDTALTIKKTNALVIMKMKDGTQPDLSGLTHVNGERRAACPAGSVPRSMLAAESCKFLDFGLPRHACRKAHVARGARVARHANRPCPPFTENGQLVCA